MIVVTGAAGFIGSNLVAGLNNKGYQDVVLVDDFSDLSKKPNYISKVFSKKIERDEFFPWLRENHHLVQIIIHLGARTDTTEFDWNVFLALNLEYTKKIWNACTEYGLPLIYASSAATYGLGENGFSDDHEIVSSLKPLNPYGRSKNEFDKWAISQVRKPFFWTGLKFFNVYGPNEYHKERMASVVYHAYNQIVETGKMKLFRSHHPEFKDGEQMRDFISVMDVVDIVLFLMEQRPFSGLFNVGTGNASSFLDLVNYTFNALGMPPSIDFIDTPLEIRDKYQYFTQADTEKLKRTGYNMSFRSLEEGVHSYVTNYLNKGDFH